MSSGRSADAADWSAGGTVLARERSAMEVKVSALGALGWVPLLSPRIGTKSDTARGA